MMPMTDPYDTHVANVRALGVEPPLDWSEVVQRFERYTYLDERPTTARLATAVIDATGDDIIALRAAAFAEAAAMPPAVAEVTAAVKAAVLDRLRELYAPHTLQNYASSADYFNDLAHKFTAAANLVDPEADAVAMVDETEKLRRAWSTAEQLAHRLSAALAGLSAAASLAGTNRTAPECLLALCVDPTGLHRRRVWEAWETSTGRTGRWGALVALGATLRAADLDGLEPYARPRPMEIKQVPTCLGVRQIMVDPEDDELQTTAAPGAVAGSPARARRVPIPALRPSDPATTH